jgi:chromosomal replication initiation ATPase DnaA
MTPGGRHVKNLEKRLERTPLRHGSNRCELTSLDGVVASFDVPTNFMRDWVSRNYSEQIR